MSQGALDTRIEVPTVCYLTQLTADSVAVPLEAPSVTVSEDPIRWQQTHLPICHPLPLLQTVALATEKPCAMDPALCKTPVLAAAQAIRHHVSFRNLQWAQSHQAILDPIETKAHRPVWPKLDAPPLQTLPLSPIKGRWKHWHLPTLTGISREHPRFFALPIRKVPIPPFRFPPEVRERFRQALAQKAGIAASNVQLKVVFQRMNVALYATVQQDEQGHLLCVPKNELIGRNLLSKNGQQLLNRLQQATENSYLVVGFRLDNKQDIRAMVPASTTKGEGQPE